jgi:hypothetical protein
VSRERDGGVATKHLSCVWGGGGRRLMRCAGRLGCGLLMALNVVDLVLGVALLLLGTFTPSAVAGLNSMLANGDDGSGDSRLDEEADRDFIKDRFW